MVDTWKNTLDTSRRVLGITNVENLEAPNRRFVGHRDILTRNLARYRFVA